jgi:hypothetical protein
MAEAAPAASDPHSPLPSGCSVNEAGADGAKVGGKEKPSTSPVWNSVRRVTALGVAMLRELGLWSKTGDPTHLCVHPLGNGKVCNTPLVMSVTDSSGLQLAHPSAAVPCVDLASLRKRCAQVLRVQVPVDSFSSVGAEALARARLEAERRYCGNKTNELIGSSQEFSIRELLATLLDPRTKGAAHLDVQTRLRAVNLLNEHLLDFTLTAEKFGARSEAEKRKAAEAEASKKQRVVSPVPKPLPPESRGARQQCAGSAGPSVFPCGTDDWAELLDADEPAVEVPAEETDEEKWAARKAELIPICKQQVNSWLRHKFDWLAEFPELANQVRLPLFDEGDAPPDAAPAAAPCRPLDIFHDLMPLPIGGLLRKLAGEDDSLDAAQKKATL